jgi:hypothetical protein
MSNEHNAAEGERDDALPSLEQIAHLDAFLEHLGAERRPASQRMTPQETTERVIAAQLQLACTGVEEPTPQFLRTLAQMVERAVARDQRRQHLTGLSRERFLGRAAQAAAAVGLVGVGAVADEVGRYPLPSLALVADAGHWYDVAAADELAHGQMKAFAAGGVLGYLVNEGGACMPSRPSARTWAAGSSRNRAPWACAVCATARSSVPMAASGRARHGSTCRASTCASRAGASTCAARRRMCRLCHSGRTASPHNGAAAVTIGLRTT